MADKLYTYAFPLYYPMYVFYKNIHDSDEMEIIRHHVKSGFTVIDLGANIGVITRLLAGLVGQTGHVHAFEPDLRNFAHLSRLTDLPNVKINHVAIGDKDGTVDLYVSEDMNVDHRTYPVDEKRKKISVECFAVDSYIKDKPVDFIKMDIEGSETEALKGAAKLLRTVRPRLAIAAYHFAPDLWRLADVVRGLNPSYKFYLRHYSETGLESVIYAL